MGTGLGWQGWNNVPKISLPHLQTTPETGER